MTSLYNLVRYGMAFRRIVFCVDAIQVFVFLLHITHVLVFFSELLSHISLTENDEL